MNANGLSLFSAATEAASKRSLENETVLSLRAVGITTDDSEIGGAAAALSAAAEGAGVTKAVGIGGGGVGGSDVFNVCGNVFADIASFDGVEPSGMNGIFTPFTKPVIPITFSLVCSRSRELLFISARTGKSYGLLPNGCSICSAAASIPNRARERMVVTGTTPHTPTSCTKIIGNEHTYTMSVDFKWVMMQPGGGWLTTFSQLP